ncbi:MAG: hypothetical protein K8S16_06750 [Bacteroidales bacterium]|nr:hypothetical protein [Bacteroidales bacterium]
MFIDMSFNGFKIEDFNYLCETISNSHKKTYSLKQYFEQSPERDFIIMRHDVDNNIDSAIKIAEIESRYGINSTYYIRLNKKTKPEKILILKSLSSEIGLHYDAFANVKGDLKKATSIFRRQLDYLNSLIDVKTISAHGSSTKKSRNTDLIKEINMKEYNLIGDAMISVDFKKLPYYTDAGRSWNLEKNKLNDFPSTMPENYKYINNTYDLCSLIQQQHDSGIYISSHPELWANNTHLDIIKEVQYGRTRYLINKVLNFITKNINYQT